jgi:putative methanogen marker protein 4
MKLTEIIRQLASKKKLRVAIGFGEEDETSMRRLAEARQEAERLGLAQTILVGKARLKGIDCYESAEPEKEILRRLKSGEVEAAVRGTLAAGSFIRAVRVAYGIDELYRIGLLETFNGKDFFFAPVGIDEGATITQKLRLISEGCSLLRALGAPVKVGILSGGRREDLGRSESVDKSIAEGELITSIARETETPDVTHYYILIENALRSDASLIIAPDGVSGNLIYRTLVHLGGGRSHGAVYCGLKDVIVDTSRAAPVGEYTGAIALAAAVAQASKFTGPS